MSDTPNNADPLTAPTTTPEQPLVSVVETLPAAPIAADNVLGAILQLASQPDKLDVNVVERLIALQQGMEDRRDEAEFHDNMALCQAEITPIIKDAHNSQTNSNYATLTAIDAIIKPIYTKYGFSVRHASETLANGAVRITCIVSRKRHSIQVYLEGPPDTVGIKGSVNKTVLHGIKSTTTYLRNATLCMAFNIALVDKKADDDGNAGGARFLTEEQQGQLLNAIQEAGKTEGRFLAAMVTGAHSVEEVNQMDLPRLMNVLAASQKRSREEAAS